MHANTRYTARERSRALKLIADGVPSKQIRAQMGCSARILNYWAKSAGVRRPTDRDRHRHSVSLRSRAIALYKRGWSAKTIADMLTEVWGTSVARQTVVVWVREAGVDIRSHQSLDDARIAELRGQGKSLAWIARDVGCSVSGVRSSLARSRRRALA